MSHYEHPADYVNECCIDIRSDDNGWFACDHSVVTKYNQIEVRKHKWAHILVDVTVTTMNPSRLTAEPSTKFTVIVNVSLSDGAPPLKMATFRLSYESPRGIPVRLIDDQARMTYHIDCETKRHHRNIQYVINFAYIDDDPAFYRLVGVTTQCLV